MTKEQAIEQIRRTAGPGLTIEDIDALATADEHQVRFVLQGWININAVRGSTALTTIVQILREVEPWVPLAGRMASVIALL